MKRSEGHPDSTVSNEEWGRVLHSAAHTFEQMPSIDAALKRSDASHEQREAAKQGRQ